MRIIGRHGLSSAISQLAANNVDLGSTQADSNDDLRSSTGQRPLLRLHGYLPVPITDILTPFPHVGIPYVAGRLLRVASLSSSFSLLFPFSSSFRPCFPSSPPHRLLYLRKVIRCVQRLASGQLRM